MKKKITISMLLVAILGGFQVSMAMEEGITTSPSTSGSESSVEEPEYQNVPQIDDPEYQNVPTIQEPEYQNVPQVDGPDYQNVPTIQEPEYQNVPEIPQQPAHQVTPPQTQSIEPEHPRTTPRETTPPTSSSGSLEGKPFYYYGKHDEGTFGEIPAFLLKKQQPAGETTPGKKAEVKRKRLSLFLVKQKRENFAIQNNTQHVILVTAQNLKEKIVYLQNIQPKESFVPALKTSQEFPQQIKFNVMQPGVHGKSTPIGNATLEIQSSSTTITIQYDKQGKIQFKTK